MGSKYKTKQLASVGHYHCENCNNDTAFNFVKHSKWFTFFFIPVFTYSNKHYLLCPICQNGYQLDSQAVRQLQEDLKV